MAVAERRRWGKAGIRLTPQETAVLDAKARTERNLAEAARVAEEEKAYKMWQAGLIRPAAITFALDAKGLHGPQVDEACLAAEPDVDMWERGALYPTWEQLCALAKLTGNLPRFFGLWDNPIPFQSTSLRFHMPVYDEPPLVWEFPREVVAATVRRVSA